MSDYEIGRGRQHDSSSSRESSPHRARKKLRPAFHGSDDDDANVDPVDGDDTPPPPNRPLIRQAVAFGGSFPTVPVQGITTYQFQPPRINNTVFLPGQAPVKEISKPKKRKKKDVAFLAQSGRFRIEGYGVMNTPAPLPIPTAQTPAPTGPIRVPEPGPYGSLYRIPDQQREDSPAAGSGTLTDASTRSRGPTRTRRTTTEPRRKPTHRSSQLSQVLPTHGLSSSPRSHRRQSPPSSSRRPSHYRHDYEPRSSRHVNADAGPSGRRAVSYSESDDHDSTEDNPGYRGYASTTSSGHKTSRQRVVNIFAQDIRSGVPDYQVFSGKALVRPAEVRRTVGEPTERYVWVDSKEILEQWQNSPARVDGPARVYTLRKQNQNQYRQILMRVTATNQDEYVSTDLQLAEADIPQLDVIIETLPVPGQNPPAPQIPVNLPSQPSLPQLALPQPVIEPSGNGRSGSSSSSSSTEPPEAGPAVDIPQQSFPLESPNFVYLPKSVVSQDKRPHRAPSPNRPPPLEASPAKTGPRPRTTDRQGLTPDIGRVARRGYESPASDDEPEAVDDAVVAAVRKLISEASGWQMFFRKKASPQTASNMLEQYRFINRMMEEYVSAPAPFKTKQDIPIEEKHVIKALMLEDEDGKLASNIKETVELVELYGRKGARLQHPEVIKLLDDNTPPIDYAKPIKRLLHLLRRINDEWRAERLREKEAERASPTSVGEYSDDP